MEDIQQDYIAVNYPRLRTQQACARLRLAFLKKCRNLKRPPTSLRLRTVKLIDSSMFSKIASKAETVLLEDAIKLKQWELKGMYRALNDNTRDQSKLEELREKEVSNVQKALDRKFHWLKTKDATQWNDWPVKKKKKKKKIPPEVFGRKEPRIPIPLNTKKGRLKATLNINKIAQEALKSGTVVNLTGLPIPDEVIAVLCKRIGFVQTGKHDTLESRTDCMATMAKLSRATTRRMKLDEDEEGSDNEERVEELPKCLRRKSPTVHYKTGDKVVDDLKDDLLKEVNTLKPSPEKTNLSNEERKGLKWIKRQTNPDKGKLRVVLADKGGALIIAHRSYIRDLEWDKLLDTERYINLGTANPTDPAQDKLLDLWRLGEDTDLVSRHECKQVVGLCERKVDPKTNILKQQRPTTLPSYKPGTPYFYGLLKIHKLRPEQLVPGVKVPIRLVTNLREAVTTKSDKFLNWKFLKPLQDDFCHDVVQDSTEVLQWLEEMNMKRGNNSSLKGFSWDFSALYDNLSPLLVIQALRCAIVECRPEWSNELANWIIQLVELSLNSAFAKYGSSWYRSLIGIPTGGSLSVVLANIAVYYALRSVLSENYAPELVDFRRSIDDIAGTWEGSEDAFNTWADKINAQLQSRFGLSIKDKPAEAWDLNNPDTFTVFLDIKFRFANNEGLITDINIKATDARAYLHYSSYHPRKTFPSIVYSQALRYRRIINNDDTLRIRLDELLECFLNSGYPKHMVRGVLKDVINRKRTLHYTKKSKEAPFPVVWVQTFGPATPKIQELINKANMTLKLSPYWRNVERPLGIVSRRGKNLGDLLLNRKKFSLENEEDIQGTVRCTPADQPSKRGRPCQGCQLMSGSATIKSKVTGKVYVVDGGNCKTKRIVYCMECILCELQYVGQTVNDPRTRCGGHRGWMKNSKKTEDNEDEPERFRRKDEGALAEHLKAVHGLTTVDDFNRSYKFNIIVSNPNDIEKVEQKWIDIMVTMHPFGLNLDKPFGVCATTLEMLDKQVERSDALR